MVIFLGFKMYYLHMEDSSLYYIKRLYDEGMKFKTLL